MAKFVKYTLITLISIIILVSGIVFGLLRFVNPNDFKSTIITQVQKYTGRKLAINGKMSWSVFPWLGISMKDVHLANAADFPAEDFAAVKKIEFRVRFMPLLSGHIDVQKVYVNGLQLNLQVNQHGVSNWADLSKAPAIAEKKHKPTTTAASDTSLSAVEQAHINQLTNIQVEDVTVSNASVTLQNLQTQSVMAISKLSINSQAIAINKSFPVLFSFEFNQQSLTNQRTTLQGFVNYQGAVVIKQATSLHTPLLDLVKLDGDLSTGNLLINKLHIDSVTAKLHLNQSIFTINPLVAKLYKGTANSHMTVNMQQAEKHYTIDSDLHQIDAANVFKDLVGTQRITGDADVTLAVTMNGNTEQQMISSLSGNGQFAFKKGEITGINVLYLLNSAVATFKHQPAPQDKSQTTPFGSLTGTLQINNGILANNDLLLLSPQYKIMGQGTTDLNTQAINYRLQAQLLNLASNNDLEKLQTKLGGNFPIVVHGSFTKIQAQPDLHAIAKAQAKDYIKKQVNKYLGDDSSAAKAASKVLDKILH